MRQVKRWKGVVFDFDGVLLDSRSVGCERFAEIARSLHLPIFDDTVERIKKIWGAPASVLVTACWPDTCVDTFMRQWEKLDGTYPIALFPGTKEAVELLSSQFVLSILTSRGRSTHFQMQYHVIGQLFSFVCTLDDSPAPKPHSSSIDPLLDLYSEHHNLSLCDLVLVGDSVHSDYGLARAISMDYIAASWGNNSREDFLAAGLPAEYVADSMEHLLQILDQ